MPTIPIHPRPPPSSFNPTNNPLPPLLHTPSGLALLELQGTIHFPTPSSTSDSTLVGHLTFPLYNPTLHGEDDTKWMKRVYFYVGESQRMIGEVKKLGKPFAVLRKREAEGEENKEELEIVEIVRFKVVFSSRPEPVSGMGDEE